MSTSNLKETGYVCSEGGPLLIADAADARLWEMNFDGSDYERACFLFEEMTDTPGAVLSLNGNNGVVWELGGAGVGHVFNMGKEHIVIIRTWPSNPETVDKLLSDLARLPLQTLVALGDLIVHSGVLAVMWSAESGASITSLEVSPDGRPSGDMVTGCSVLLMNMNTGNYSCFHDEVQVYGNQARRCHLLLQTE